MCHQNAFEHLPPSDVLFIWGYRNTVIASILKMFSMLTGITLGVGGMNI